jgi:hypothetical protein
MALSSDAIILVMNGVIAPDDAPAYRLSVTAPFASRRRSTEYTPTQ